MRVPHVGQDGAGLTGANVLVVEDEGLVARDIALTLEELGYNVAGTTGTGEEGLQLAADLKPDVVLMDIRLAGRLDGIDAAARIKRELDLPVVFLTAHSDEPTVQRAAMVEPFGYLLKPFEPSDLQVVIEVTLQKHAAERTQRRQQELLKTILASVEAGVIGVDEDLRVRFMNARAEAITGWDAAHAEGMPIGDVLDLSIPGSAESVDEVVEAAFRRGRERWSMGAVWSRDGPLTLVDGVVAPVPAVAPDEGRLAVISLSDRSSTARIEDLVEERNRLRAEIRHGER